MIGHIWKSSCQNNDCLRIFIDNIVMTQQILSILAIIINLRTLRTGASVPSLVVAKNPL